MGKWLEMHSKFMQKSTQLGNGNIGNPTENGSIGSQV